MSRLRAVDEELLQRGARKLAEVNARVAAGERVLVVTDPSMTEMADRIARAAAQAGGEVVTCVIPVRRWDGEEPPVAAAAAMREAQVIFSPVAVSITHTPAMWAALKAGARAILMTAYTDEILAGSALLETDFGKAAEVCRRLGDALAAADRVRLTSPRGTDLRFSIGGRGANVLTNVPDPGELAPVPDIEVNVVPLEGTAQGRVIADASVPYLGIGVLEEPIICTIEDGFVTTIEGGEQARILSDALESHDDPNCYNVAELGIGLNPNACLTGRMLDDEGVLGTIHMGIGTNFTLGGTVVAPSHYDLLMWEPTIELDGAIVQEDQNVLV